MITNIYFVRHAHSAYTPEELNRPLSERGLKEAKEVTKLLSEEKITHVMSSPYKRATQTVDGIANRFNLNIILDKGFREKKLASGSIENFKEVVYKSWENFHFSLAGGETCYFAQDRGVTSLKKALDKYCGGNVVIGTHGNIMVLIMNYYDKKYNYNFWDDLNMPDIYKLSFENESLMGVTRIWV